MSHFPLGKDEPWLNLPHGWLNLPHGYVISNGSILLNYIGNRPFKKPLCFRINFNINLTLSETVWPNNAKVLLYIFPLPFQIPIS